MQNKTISIFVMRTLHYFLLGLLTFVSVSSGAPRTQDQTRIVGGKKSPPGKRPFIAGLYSRESKGLICGGVIWDRNTILTAHHCVASSKADDIIIYLGHVDIRDISKMFGAYVFKAIEIILNPDYDYRDSKADLALIRLDRDIDFAGVNSKAKCVCDPEPLELLHTTACVTMGWGIDDEIKRPDTLLEVVLPILDKAICEFSNPVFDPKYHICAGYVNAGLCVGDSGGPLVCQVKSNPSKYSLVGIASFGIPPCGEVPSYFTKVEPHFDWIGKMAAPVVSTTTTEASWWHRWVVGETTHDEERR